MTYSPYAHLLVSGSNDLSIKVWTERGSHIFTFKGHSKPILRLVVLDDIAVYLDQACRELFCFKMHVIYNLSH